MLNIISFVKEKLRIKHLIMAAFILILIFAAFIAIFHTDQGIFSEEIYHSRFVEPKEVFNRLDADHDGILTLEEFLESKRIYRISVIEESLEQDVQEFPDLEISPLDQTVTIQASFQKLDVSSLTKDVKSIPHDYLDALSGLLNWSVPFKKSHDFSSRAFSLFMPSVSQSLSPGTSWWVVKASDGNGLLSSKRYYPTLLEERLRPLFALLSMFHPRTFLWTRFGPQGTFAVLRAAGDYFLDIVFRVHAEYQLNEPPMLPFWFTPAQFSGRLIISKDGQLVQYFHLEVPTQKKLNVDMEWLNGPSEYEDMEVDIGHIPEMRLSSDPSDNPSRVLRRLCLNDRLLCEGGIPVEEALHIIEQNFYSFTKVKYHNFSEAFRIATMESKLVHGIILWGSLDDQSC